MKTFCQYSERIRLKWRLSVNIPSMYCNVAQQLVRRRCSRQRNKAKTVHGHLWKVFSCSYLCSGYFAPSFITRCIFNFGYARNKRSNIIILPIVYISAVSSCCNIDILHSRTVNERLDEFHVWFLLVLVYLAMFNTLVWLALKSVIRLSGQDWPCQPYLVPCLLLCIDQC